MRYQYRCKACGAIVEMTVRGAETHLVRDEDGEYDCGPLRRVWSVTIGAGVKS